MKFYIKQKVFSLRDRFKVLDVNGKEVFQVTGKMFSLSNKMELQNLDGSQVLNAKRKILSLLPKYYILNPHGDQIAEVQKKFAIRPKFNILVDNHELQVEGSLFAHSFGIFDDGTEVASITKKVISWGDTYEIEINQENNIELYLFMVIIIDQVIHEQKNKRNDF